MESKDFTPRINYKPCLCFPFWKCCDEEIIIDDARIVREIMNHWIRDQGNKITVKNVETFDFETNIYIVEKAYYRVWYVKNI